MDLIKVRMFWKNRIASDLQRQTQLEELQRWGMPI